MRYRRKELLVSVYLTQVKLCSTANDIWSYSVDVRVQGLIFPELRRDCYPGERSRGGGEGISIMYRYTN